MREDLNIANVVARGVGLRSMMNPTVLGDPASTKDSRYVCYRRRVNLARRRSVDQCSRNYDGGVGPSLNNALAGRRAFTGTTGGYRTTQMDISSLADSNTRFRFRMVADNGVALTGWWTITCRCSVASKQKAC